MTQFILFVVLAGGSTFQTIGPFTDKGLCIETRDVITKTFRKSSAECIRFDQPMVQNVAPVPPAK